LTLVLCARYSSLFECQVEGITIRDPLRRVVRGKTLCNIREAARCTYTSCNSDRILGSYLFSEWLGSPLATLWSPRSCSSDSGSVLCQILSKPHGLVNPIPVWASAVSQILVERGKIPSPIPSVIYEDRTLATLWSRVRSSYITRLHPNRERAPETMEGHGDCASGRRLQAGRIISLTIVIAL
jgi:hypothetical protein